MDSAMTNADLIKAVLEQAKISIFIRLGKKHMWLRIDSVDDVRPEDRIIYAHNENTMGPCAVTIDLNQVDLTAIEFLVLAPKTIKDFAPNYKEHLNVEEPSQPSSP
jgi:hypothetical protein